MAGCELELYFLQKFVETRSDPILRSLQGKWWFGKRDYTKDGALNSTAAVFFHRLEESSTVPEILTLLSSATELGQVDKTDAAGSATKADVGVLEEIVKAKAAELGVEGVMDGRYDCVQSRRSAVIIWSHLLRVEFDDEALKEGEFNASDLTSVASPFSNASLTFRFRVYFVERSTLLLSLPPLLTSLLNVSLSHNWLSTSLTIMKLHALLIQATLPTLPKLLQLPHFTYAQAKAAEEKLRSLKGAGGIEAWNRISKAKRDEILNTVGGVWTENESEETLEVARSWPKLEVLSAKFKGELVRFCSRTRRDASS